MSLQTMMSRTVIVGIAVVLLGGCGAASRSGPDPTWSCTPDGSGEPCTEQKAAAQAQAQAQEAEAYAEAMRAYREFMKEMNRVMAAGGVESPTGTMERYAAGEYLAFFSENVAFLWEVGATGKPGVEIEAVQPVSISGDSLTLRSCEDGSANLIVGSTGEVLGVGSRGSVEILAERIDGNWVIVDIFHSEVEVCDV